MNDDDGYDMTDGDLEVVDTHLIPCRSCGKEFEAEGEWLSGEVTPTFDPKETKCRKCKVVR